MGDAGDATVAAEVNNVSGKRVLEGTHAAILRLGKLEPAAIEERRAEVVLESIVEEARRIRKLENVVQVGGWRKAAGGQVATTFDMPEKEIHKNTNSKIWGRSSMRASNGIVIFATEERWKEIAPLLASLVGVAGIIRESPKWAIIEPSSASSGERIAGVLRMWRNNKAITEDVCFRTWETQGERILIKPGSTCEEASVTLYVYDADPRFTTSCCQAFLRTFGVKEAEIAIAEKHTEIDDEEEGPKYTCTRTVSMRVPITTAARIENITREIEWEGDEILVKPVRSALKEEPQKEDADMTEQATGTGSKRGAEDGDSATDEEEYESVDEGTTPAAATEEERKSWESGTIVRAPRISDGTTVGSGTQPDFETLKLIVKTPGGWKVERLDTKPVKCEYRGNGSSKGWLVQHDDAKTLGCHSAGSKWFGPKAGENAKEQAEETRKEWQEKINGGELVSEEGLDTSKTTARLRYSLNKARTCDRVEGALLGAASAGVDTTMKVAAQENARRRRQSVRPKRQCEDGGEKATNKQDDRGERAVDSKHE